MPHHVINTTFVRYNNECRVSSGITANGKDQNLWSAGHSSSGLRFPDNSNRFYFAPEANGMLGFELMQDAGSQALSYVWKDVDGSLVGGKGGFAVTNNQAILPAQGVGCTQVRH